MWRELYTIIHDHYRISLREFFVFMFTARAAAGWRKAFRGAIGQFVREHEIGPSSWFSGIVQYWHTLTNYSILRRLLRKELGDIGTLMKRMTDPGAKPSQNTSSRAWKDRLIQTYCGPVLQKLAEIEFVRTNAPTWFSLLAAATPSGAFDGQPSKYNWVGPMVANLAGTIRPHTGGTFKLLTGMFMWSQGLTRTGLGYLQSIGVSPSYDTINRHLHHASREHGQNLRELATQRNRVVNWDNIQFKERVRDKSVGDEDRFLNYTTGFMKISTCIPMTGIRREQFRPDKRLRIADIFPFDPIQDQRRQKIEDDLWVHFIFEALRIVAPDISSIRDPERPSTPQDVSISTARPRLGEILTPQQSTTMTLAALPYDEATEKGTIDITNDIHLRQFGIPKDDPQWEENLFIISGDALTVSRIQLMQSSLAPSRSAFDRSRWILPIMGLFHLRMNYLDAIVSYHFGGPSDDKSTLYRTWHTVFTSRYIPTKSFEQMHKLVTNAFYAKLTALVLTYFKNTQAIHIQNTELDAFREIIHSLAGPQLEEMLLWVHNFLKSKLFAHTQSAPTEMRQGQALVPEPAANDDETLRRRDDELQNNVHFLRNVFPYILLTEAVKSGDIHLLRHALKDTLVMFCGMPRRYNYQHELCRLIWLTCTDATDEHLKDWILEEMLVNRQGLKNTWYEMDRFNELINYNVRVANHSKRTSSHSVITLLSRYLSTNDLLTWIKEQVDEYYGTRQNKRHAIKPVQFLIWMLVKDLVNSEHGKSSLEEVTGRGSVSSIPDLWKEGMVQLPDVINRFNKLTDMWRAGRGDAVLKQFQLHDQNQVLQELLPLKDHLREYEDEQNSILPLPEQHTDNIPDDMPHTGSPPENSELNGLPDCIDTTADFGDDAAHTESSHVLQNIIEADVSIDTLAFDEGSETYDELDCLISSDQEIQATEDEEDSEIDQQIDNIDFNADVDKGNGRWTYRTRNWK
jgi:hypothetical protein